MVEKLRLGVIFGGESGEHEVSVMSAQAVIEAARERFEVVPIGVTRSGAWLTPDETKRQIGRGGEAYHQALVSDETVTPEDEHYKHLVSELGEHYMRRPGVVIVAAITCTADIDRQVGGNGGEDTRGGAEGGALGIQPASSRAHRQAGRQVGR